MNSEKLTNEFSNLKLPNKYYWFVLLSVIFALDSLIGNLYYLLVPVMETDVQWRQRITVYCMSKGLSGSFIYFYIAFFRHFKRLDCIDVCLAVLCGVVSIYSAVRVIYGAIYISDWWYWCLFLPFYFILLKFRISN